MRWGQEPHRRVYTPETLVFPPAFNNENERRSDQSYSCRYQLLHKTLQRCLSSTILCLHQPFLTLWNFFLLVTSKQEKTEYLWQTALAFILFVVCSVLFPQLTYLFLSLSFCLSLLWFCCTFTNLIVYYPGNFGFKEAYSSVFYCDWFHHALIQPVYQYKHN